MLSMAFIQGCNASQMTSQQADILFNCTVDATGLAQGRVVLKCSASNLSGNTLRLLPWNTPLESRLMGRFLDITDQIGTSLAYQGLMVKRASPEDQDYIEIQAGEDLVNSLDLTISYSFCANRVYQISYSTEQYREDGSTIKLHMPTVAFSTTNSFNDCN